jgi:hypothetical protein
MYKAESGFAGTLTALSINFSINCHKMNILKNRHTFRSYNVRYFMYFTDVLTGG